MVRIHRLGLVKFLSTAALFSGAALVACSASRDGGDSDGGSDSNSDSGVDASDGSGVDSGNDSGVDGNDGGLDGVDGTDGANTGGNGNGICDTYQATSKPNPPTILILLDQSGSMKEGEGGTTRWAAATSSVSDAVKSLDGVANFGLIGFPTHVISSDQDASQTCNAHLKSAPAPNNGDALAATINLTTPTIGHTPVRAALNLAKVELAKPEYADTARYVVLVTDGLPNCKNIAPTHLGTSGFANYEDPSDAVTALKNDGVTTFVVGYSIAGLSQWSEGVEHVAVTYANNMAAAGGTGMHHAVSTGAQLEAVLNDITAQVAPCSFELDEAPRGGPSYVRVSIDGVDYALGDANGWDLEGDKTVALREDGAACGVLRDGGEHSIQIQVECQPVVVR